MSLKTTLLSALALIAFAGNSVLCRLALSNGSIDPASFTGIRLASGAIMLLLLVWGIGLLKARHAAAQQSVNKRANLSSIAALMLFAYAALFSFAYTTLATGVGALILFGSVQISMVCISLVQGNRMKLFEWLGLLIACVGLVYLVLPELSEPSIIGFIMMAMAGMAWSMYTILGQGSQNPLNDTSSNFIRSLPLAIILLLIYAGQLSATPSAWLLAISSGAITSGLGYAIWYAALRDLTTSQAGVMQLLVPVIAALGGVVFANELLSERLIISSMLTLGGILIVLLAKKRTG
ncbi:MAG: drug/metabolite transporter (DMT)-like permease [Arenicella sp.]|jgi:drug/metabolite transporter (DMT)-like permease